MVCLLPDGCVGIYRVPHVRGPPSPCPLRGRAIARWGDLNSVYTEFETGLFYLINPTPDHLLGNEAWPLGVQRCWVELRALLFHLWFTSYTFPLLTMPC